MWRLLLTCKPPTTVKLPTQVGRYLCKYLGELMKYQVESARLQNAGHFNPPHYSGSSGGHHLECSH